MSATREVPEAVPSLFHNSGPWTPSSALKKSVPLTARWRVGVGTRGGRPGIDVFDQDGCRPRCRRSSTAPCRAPRHCGEEQRPVTLIRSSGMDRPPRGDVLDQGGACRSGCLCGSDGEHHQQRQRNGDRQKTSLPRALRHPTAEHRLPPSPACRRHRSSGQGAIRAAAGEAGCAERRVPPACATGCPGSRGRRRAA